MPPQLDENVDWAELIARSDPIADASLPDMRARRRPGTAIAAIAVPGLLRARMSGNEASAIGSLRAINGGEAAYSSSCAGGGYAVTLADLALAPAGSTQGFISPDLKTDPSVKSGYSVALFKEPGAANVGTAAGTCNASTGTPVSSFEATANPVTAGSTGTR